MEKIRNFRRNYNYFCTYFSERGLFRGFGQAFGQGLLSSQELVPSTANYSEAWPRLRPGLRHRQSSREAKN